MVGFFMFDKIYSLQEQKVFGNSLLNCEKSASQNVLLDIKTSKLQKYFPFVQKSYI